MAKSVTSRAEWRHSLIVYFIEDDDRFDGTMLPRTLGNTD